MVTPSVRMGEERGREAQKTNSGRRETAPSSAKAPRVDLSLIPDDEEDESEDDDELLWGEGEDDDRTARSEYVRPKKKRKKSEEKLDKKTATSKEHHPADKLLQTTSRWWRFSKTKLESLVAESPTDYVARLEAAKKAHVAWSHEVRQGLHPQLHPVLTRLANLTAEERFVNPVCDWLIRPADLGMCQLAGAGGVDVVEPVPQNPEQDGEGGGGDGDGGVDEDQAPGADDAADDAPDPAGAVQHLLGLLRQALGMPPRGGPAAAGPAAAGPAAAGPAAAAPTESIVIQTGSRLNTVDSVLASGSTLMARVGFDTYLLDLAAVRIEPGADGLPMGIPPNLVVDARGQKAFGISSYDCESISLGPGLPLTLSAPGIRKTLVYHRTVMLQAYAWLDEFRRVTGRHCALLIGRYIPEQYGSAGRQLTLPSIASMDVPQYEQLTWITIPAVQAALASKVDWFEGVTDLRTPGQNWSYGNSAVLKSRLPIEAFVEASKSGRTEELELVTEKVAALQASRRQAMTRRDAHTEAPKLSKYLINNKIVQAVVALESELTADDAINAAARPVIGASKVEFEAAFEGVAGTASIQLALCSTRAASLDWMADQVGCVRKESIGNIASLGYAVFESAQYLISKTAACGLGAMATYLGAQYRHILEAAHVLEQRRIALDLVWHSADSGITFRQTVAFRVDLAATTIPRLSLNALCLAGIRIMLRFDVNDPKTATPSTKIIRVGVSASTRVKRGTPRTPLSDAEKQELAERRMQAMLVRVTAEVQNASPARVISRLSHVTEIFCAFGVQDGPIAKQMRSLAAAAHRRHDELLLADKAMLRAKEDKANKLDGPTEEFVSFRLAARSFLGPRAANSDTVTQHYKTEAEPQNELFLGDRAKTAATVRRTPSSSGHISVPRRNQSNEPVKSAQERKASKRQTLY